MKRFSLDNTIIALCAIFFFVGTFNSILFLQGNCSKDEDCLRYNGYHDFIEYWTAYQLYKQGENPYDGRALFELQKPLGWNEPHPLMMWNPPWLLSSFSLMLDQSFADAGKTWYFLNACFLLTSVILTWKTVGGSGSALVFSWVTAMLFHPARSTLNLGQISLLLSFCFCGIFYALTRRNYILLGIFIIPMTLKPHLGYLLWIVIALYIIRERAAWKTIASFVIGLTAVIAQLYYQNSSALAFWFDSFSQPADGSIVTVAQWRVATLVGVVRGLLTSGNGFSPMWPVAVVPGLVRIPVLYYLISKRVQLEWLSAFPTLLAISLATAPYGWVFDHSPLLIIQTGLFCLASKMPTKRKTLLGYTIIVFLLILVHTSISSARSYGFGMHHHYFWIPIAYLVFWEIGRRYYIPLTK